MVIKRDYPLLADGLERVEYLSDGGFMIRKVGTDEVYSNAIELSETSVEYEETDWTEITGERNQALEALWYEEIEGVEAIV